jgi:hypothetical protein
MQAPRKRPGPKPKEPVITGRVFLYRSSNVAKRDAFAAWADRVCARVLVQDNPACALNAA